jgi:hypothetical protein
MSNAPQQRKWANCFISNWIGVCWVFPHHAHYQDQDNLDRWTRVSKCEKELKAEWSFDFQGTPFWFRFCWSFDSADRHLTMEPPDGAINSMERDYRDICPCQQGTAGLAWGTSLALIREGLSFSGHNNAGVNPAPWPCTPEIGAVLASDKCFPDNLCVVSFSFSALLGLVSQNGIFLLTRDDCLIITRCSCSWQWKAPWISANCTALA